MGFGAFRRIRADLFTSFPFVYTRFFSLASFVLSTAFTTILSAVKTAFGRDGVGLPMTQTIKLFSLD